MRFFVAISLLCTAPLAAQSHPGVTFDENIRTIARNGESVDTSSQTIHVIAAGSNLRFEMGATPTEAKVLPIGEHPVMIMTGGGATMFFLDSDKKEYMSLKPLEMMAGVRQMMESMGGSFQFDSTKTRFALDSLGPGPTINGHPTLHYRMEMAFRMTVSMMGSVTAVEQESSTDIQAATDLGDVKDVAAGMNRFAEITQAMGVGKDLMDRALAAQEKMRGFPIRMVKQETRTAAGVKTTVTETIENSNIKHVSVPDSSFVVPPDYKPVSMPGLSAADSTSQ